MIRSVSEMFWKPSWILKWSYDMILVLFCCTHYLKYNFEFLKAQANPGLKAFRKVTCYKLASAIPHFFSFSSRFGENLCFPGPAIVNAETRAPTDISRSISLALLGLLSVIGFLPFQRPLDRHLLITFRALHHLWRCIWTILAMLPLQQSRPILRFPAKGVSRKNSHRIWCCSWGIIVRYNSVKSM